jgi:PhnB protein
MEIPKNYQTVMPYLILKDAPGFIHFVEKVFGGKETYKVMRDEHIIMHGEVMIGGSTVMFADVTDQFQPRNAGMFVYVENADEAYQLALNEGATKLTEMADQPYGRSGGVKDPFGNDWWITTVLKANE